MNDFMHAASIDPERVEFPTTPQELFEFAIGAQHSVNGEYSCDTRRDAIRLRAWARSYAAQHGLVAPTDDIKYGIWYPVEPEEEKGAS